MTRLYLVRHGTHDLVGKALAGHMPGVLLSSAGQEQAELLAKHFAALDVGRVLSSPLERCRETASPIAAALKLPVEPTEALIEIDCGDWTGLTFAELHKDPRWPGWNNERTASRMPGGDSIEAVRARCMPLVQDLAARDRAPVIAVSHSDVVKVVVLTLLGASLDLHDRVEIDPASITTIDLWPGGGKIVRMNETVAA